MINLFYGQDNFSIEQAIENIKERAQESEVLVVKEGSPVNELINLLSTNSFFSEKRIIVVKEYLNQSLSDSEQKNLAERLDTISKDTIVIFQETKEPKGIIGKFLKDKATIKTFSPPTNKELISFIKKRAQEEDSEIAPLAAERLASFVGPDLRQLEQEIRKLALYKRDDITNEGIQVSDVELLVKANFESNIFELLDAIAAKNTSKSIGLVNSFLESGENEIYILTMIARQFRNIALAKFEDNITEGKLAKKAGLHPFVAKKSIMQAHNFSEKEIVDVYNKIATADLRLKSGYNPKNVLQSLAL